MNLTTGTATAIIPARGGSKGVLRKNLRLLGGQPLIAHTIAAARGSGLFERVIVSTDDPEIAGVAAGLGAEVPFLRPAELATDEAPGSAPVLHALQWLYRTEGFSPTWVVNLQPTSPLRTSEDIRAAWSIAVNNQADTVVSVTPVVQRPEWTVKLHPQGELEFDLSRKGNRRQDLEPLYVLNGAIYISRAEVVMRTSSLYGERCFGYVMPRDRSIDIDTEVDLDLAEFFLARR